MVLSFKTDIMVVTTRNLAFLFIKQATVFINKPSFYHLIEIKMYNVKEVFTYKYLKKLVT